MADDYRQANYVPLDNYGRLDILKAKYTNLKFSVPASSTFQVTSAYEFNLPGISLAVYNDMDFWWAIALYNDIYDPLTDVVVSRMLLIPDMTSLLNLLNSNDASNSADEVLL